MDERLSLSNLDDQQRQQALERFCVIRPILEDGLPLSRIAATQGISVRSLQRWIQHYQMHGLVGLARKPRADRGHHRLPTELHHLIEGLALQRPPPTMATIHRQVIAVATQHGWPVPSYATVPALRHFALSLGRDYAAVRASLIFDWSSGQVEGQANRLKVIKRIMYGRAGFDLLRLRVLQPP